MAPWVGIEPTTNGLTGKPSRGQPYRIVRNQGLRYITTAKILLSTPQCNWLENSMGNILAHAKLLRADDASGREDVQPRPDPLLDRQVRGTGNCSSATFAERPWQSDSLVRVRVRGRASGAAAAKPNVTTTVAACSGPLRPTEIAWTDVSPPVTSMDGIEVPTSIRRAKPGATMR
jgi:hypothetical protein